MPHRPSSPCPQPGCPKLQPCPLHPRRRDRRAEDQRRGTRHQRGYGKDHEAMRAQVLAEEPWCAICGTHPSSVADHILPRSMGGTDDRSNYRGLCRSCSQRYGAQSNRRPAWDRSTA